MVSHANWQSAICASFAEIVNAGKIINLFALDGNNMLQVQAFAPVDSYWLSVIIIRRTADHRAFDRLPYKTTAILYLRKRNLYSHNYRAEGNLNQPIFRQLYKASRTG